MAGTFCAVCGRTLPVDAVRCPACGSIRAADAQAGQVDPAIAAGEELQRTLGDGYRVESVIGRGGYAVVYQVYDDRLDRRLAVKVLHPDLAASGDVAERFRREARTAARLTHPNIVPIYFVGGGDLPCIAMPLVAGETLGARLAREGQLPYAVVLSIARDIGAALDFAHAAGVVHRDVKPDNILIELASGRSMLTDFGIAKAFQDSAAITSSGIALGTPRYMAPEQIAGERPIDGRADIYSLGIVVYEMLAGRVPFSSAMVQSVFAQHLHAEPPPIWTRAADVNERAERALHRALAKLPDERYDRAGELVRDLEQAHGRPSLRSSGASIAAQRAPDQITLFRTLNATTGAAALGALARATDAALLVEAAAAVEQRARAVAPNQDTRLLVEALLALTARADDERPAFREPVRDALRRLGGDAAIVNALAAGWLRHEALRDDIEAALARLLPEGATALVAVARHEKRPELFLLADRVGALDDARATELARDPSVGVAFAFVTALGESVRESRVLERWLAAALRHPNAKLRESALAVAADRGGVIAEHVGRIGLADGEPAVRTAAVVALGRSRRREALPELARMLERGTTAEQLAAVAALGEIGGAAVVPILTRVFERRQLFRKERGEVQWAAARVLSALPPAIAGDALFSLASDRDPTLATIATKAITNETRPERS